jgi:hypothetical protein
MTISNEHLLLRQVFVISLNRLYCAMALESPDVSNVPLFGAVSHLQVDVFDPTAKVLALTALVHDSERVFLPMPPPCPFQVLSSEVSTNGECGRTVISAVNQVDFPAPD